MIKYLYYPIIVILLIITTLQIIPVVRWSAMNIAEYQWMLYGVAAYIVSSIFLFSRNKSWLQTFAHELSHTIVSLMFFRKIHSFYAEEHTGVITHSSRRRFGDIFISLAPYCLPYFTYLVIFLRIIGASQMFFVFDILIGFTLAFHIGCFIKQTGSYQTDIQQHGLACSYLFIVTALVFNLTMVLLSVRFGIVDAAAYIFPRYWDNIINLWDTIKEFGSSLSIVWDFLLNIIKTIIGFIKNIIAQF